MTQLIVLVCMYMLVSVGIGLWAARRVRNTVFTACYGDYGYFCHLVRQ